MIPRSLAGALAVLMVAVIEPEDDDAVEQDYTTVQELIQQGTLPGDQAPSSHEPGTSSGPEDVQATASREDSGEPVAEVDTTNSETGWLDQEEPAVAVRVQHWQNGRWGRAEVLTLAEGSGPSDQSPPEEEIQSGASTQGDPGETPPEPEEPPPAVRVQHWRCGRWGQTEILTLGGMPCGDHPRPVPGRILTRGGMSMTGACDGCA